MNGQPLATINLVAPIAMLWHTIFYHVHLENRWMIYLISIWMVFNFLSKKSKFLARKLGRNIYLVFGTTAMNQESNRMVEMIQIRLYCLPNVSMIPRHCHQAHGTTYNCNNLNPVDNTRCNKSMSTFRHHNNNGASMVRHRKHCQPHLLLPIWTVHYCNYYSVHCYHNTIHCLWLNYSIRLINFRVIVMLTANRPEAIYYSNTVVVVVEYQLLQ